MKKLLITLTIFIFLTIPTHTVIRAAQAHEAVALESGHGYERAEQAHKMNQERLKERQADLEERQRMLENQAQTANEAAQTARENGKLDERRKQLALQQRSQKEIVRVQQHRQALQEEQVAFAENEEARKTQRQQDFSAALGYEEPLAVFNDTIAHLNRLSKIENLSEQNIADMRSDAELLIDLGLAMLNNEDLPPFDPLFITQQILTLGRTPELIAALAAPRVRNMVIDSARRAIQPDAPSAGKPQALAVLLLAIDAPILHELRITDVIQINADPETGVTIGDRQLRSEWFEQLPIETQKAFAQAIRERINPHTNNERKNEKSAVVALASALKYNRLVSEGVDITRLTLAEVDTALLILRALEELAPNLKVIGLKVIRSLLRLNEQRSQLYNRKLALLKESGSPSELLAITHEMLELFEKLNILYDLKAKKAPGEGFGKIHISDIFFDTRNLSRQRLIDEYNALAERAKEVTNLDNKIQLQKQQVEILRQLFESFLGRINVAFISSDGKLEDYVKELDNLLRLSRSLLHKQSPIAPPKEVMTAIYYSLEDEQVRKTLEDLFGRQSPWLAWSAEARAHEYEGEAGATAERLALLQRRPKRSEEGERRQKAYNHLRLLELARDAYTQMGGAEDKVAELERKIAALKKQRLYQSTKEQALQFNNAFETGLLNLMEREIAKAEREALKWGSPKTIRPVTRRFAHKISESKMPDKAKLTLLALIRYRRLVSVLSFAVIAALLDLLSRKLILRSLFKVIHLKS